MNQDLPNPPPNRGERFLMLDGLRGIAALWVAVFHIYGTGRSIQTALPRPLGFVLAHGDLGVPIFFVLSGFAIAWSLRAVQLDLPTLGRFMLRRSIRLDPPYWATIACFFGVVGLSNVVLKDRTVGFPPPSTVVAHVLYLPDILGIPKLVEVFWTLFVEIQFYLFFTLLLWLAQALVRRAFPDRPATAHLAVFAPVMLLSLGVNLVIRPGPAWHGVFVPYWYAYALGVFACWSHDGRLDRRWLWALLALTAGGVATLQNPFAGAVAATTALIAVASHRAAMNRWLSGSTLQYLGKVSYSLYLVHPLFGQRSSNLVFRLIGESEGKAVVACGVGLACSLAAAHTLWWAIERPSIALAKRIRMVPPLAPGVDREPLSSPQSG